MINKKDKEILDKIKSSKIQPRPRWHFVLKNYFIWFFSIMAMIVGALSFSVVIYMLKFNDRGMYYEPVSSLAKFIVVSLPYFWLALLTIFVLLIFFNLKHTKHGYRFSLLVLDASKNAYGD